MLTIENSLQIKVECVCKSIKSFIFKYFYGDGIPNTRKPTLRVGFTGLSPFSDEIFIYPGVTSRSLWLVSEELSRRLIAFHILDSVSCNSPNKTDLVAPTVCLSTVHLQYIS